MAPRTALLGVLIVVAVAVAAFALAEEKAEVVNGPATPAQSDGEWSTPVPGRAAVVWAVGDADPPRSGRVARLIRRADPDRILYLGDVYPTGTPADFDRWARPWGRLVRRMAPTPGNHEWPQAEVGYEPFWQEVTGETPPARYSFRAAGWEILSLNSEEPDLDAAEAWLRERTRGRGDCRIAFWHRPRYTAGKYRNFPVPESATRYWDALEGRARIVLNGHDHNLQRMRRRDGIVEFVVGAGGRKLHPVDERVRRLAFSDDRRYGALRLRLTPGRASWRFVAAGGTVLDSGSLRCHA